jgi:hypothetical protein
MAERSGLDVSTLMDAAQQCAGAGLVVIDREAEQSGHQLQ